MSKYIDADLLRAEIEKRMHICDGIFERDSNTYYQGKAVAYQETLPLIDSLQQERPEVDLELDAVQFCFDKGFNITPYQAKTIARHFYELGQLEMRHRITNPEYNTKVVEQLKSEYPARKEDSYEIH